MGWGFRLLEVEGYGLRCLGSKGLWSRPAGQTRWNYTDACPNLYNLRTLNPKPRTKPETLNPKP